MVSGLTKFLPRADCLDSALSLTPQIGTLEGLDSENPQITFTFPDVRDPPNHYSAGRIVLIDGLFSRPGLSLGRVAVSS